jgi:hypothetical protein
LKAGYSRLPGERPNSFVAFGAEGTFEKSASFAPPA